jgi:hypothetical protein
MDAEGVRHAVRELQALGVYATEDADGNLRIRREYAALLAFMLSYGTHKKRDTQRAKTDFVRRATGASSLRVVTSLDKASGDPVQAVELLRGARKKTTDG